ncbi:CCA tRNA nucleotidyltransferase [Spirochaeta dissipatitropha]
MNPVTKSSEIKKRIPPYLFDFARMFTDAGYEAVLVGGAVRDIVMGTIPDDFDFASSAKPEQVATLFPKVLNTGIQHGTVSVFFHGKLIEVTTFRIDGNYSDSRRPDSVLFTSNLSEDLSRRDFTINALALSLPECRLIDETDGVNDIREGIIRAIGEAKIRFHEDALRIIRGLRFSSRLGFRIDPDTSAAMKSCSHLMNKLAAERLRVEWIKLLSGSQPDQPIAQLIELGQTHLFLPCLPENTLSTTVIPKISDFSQSISGHDTWLWRASILAWRMLPEVSLKDNCFIEKSFFERRYTKQECKSLTRIISAIGQELPDANTSSIRMFLYAVSPCKWADLYLARKILGTRIPDSSIQNRIIAEENAGVIAHIKDLRIDGGRIMKLLDRGSGPWLGKLLNDMLLHVVIHPEDNTPQNLEKLAESMSANMN